MNNGSVDPKPTINKHSSEESASIEPVRSWTDVESNYRNIGKTIAHPLRNILRDGIARIEKRGYELASTNDERRDVKREIKRLNKLFKHLDDIEEYAAAIPKKMLDELAHGLQTADLTLENDAIDEARSKIAELPPRDRRELQHLNAVLTRRSRNQ